MGPPSPFLQINMNILQREKIIDNSNKNLQPQEEELPPECVDTKLIIWEDDAFQEFETDYLNQVYPEKINKATMNAGSTFVFHFLSSSLNYWVELKDGESIDSTKLSTKDSKYLSTVFSEDGCENFPNYNRWGFYFNKRNNFMQCEKEEKNFKPPTGQKVHEYERHGEKYQVHKYLGDNPEFIPYKMRFEILFLFYIDGVSFVEEETKEWEYYVIYRQHEGRQVFVGVLSKYIFKITSIKQRQRISQVFILPSYQKHGHGKEIIDLVYKDSLENSSCFQLTTEVPSFEYQCLRDFKELEMILQRKLVDFSNVRKVANKEDIQKNQEFLLNKEILRKIKQEIKIPGNQIERLMNLLIYARILAQDDNDMARAHFEEITRQRIIFNRSAFKSRKKVPHITFGGQLSDMKEFFLEKAQEDLKRNQEEIQEILTETIDGFVRVIRKLEKNGLLKQHVE